MLGNMMVALNKRILKSYAKLGDRLGLSTNLDQRTLDTKGVVVNRLIIEFKNGTK